MKSRLFRGESDRMLGGVCGGLGRYFNVDPVLVRLLFVLGTIAGVSILIYQVLWAIIPTESRVGSHTNQAIEDGAAEMAEAARPLGSILGHDTHTWDLRLNPKVPTTLKVNGGVGKTELDLSGMRITGLELHAGVSETQITMPGTGQFQGAIEGGVGTVTLFVSKGMAVKVESQRVLGGVEANGPFEKRGNSYVTPGYEGARDRAELSIRGGIGKVTIQEVGS